MSAHAVAALFQPETLLPSQLMARSGASPCPELRLVTAIFEDAVRSVCRYADVRRGAQHHEFLDACDWVFSDDRAWPFAFLNVCDVLGFDVTAVRQSLLVSIATQRRAAEDAEEERNESRAETDERRTAPPSLDPEQRRFEIVGWDEV